MCRASSEHRGITVAVSPLYTLHTKRIKLIFHTNFLHDRHTHTHTHTNTHTHTHTHYELVNACINVIIVCACMSIPPVLLFSLFWMCVCLFLSPTPFPWSQGGGLSVLSFSPLSLVAGWWSQCLILLPPLLGLRVVVCLVSIPYLWY